MLQRGSLTASEVKRFANEGYLLRLGPLTPLMVVQLLEVLEAVRFGMAAAVDKVCRLYQWESTPESVSSRVTDIDVERL